MNATSRRLSAHVQHVNADHYRQESDAAWRAHCLLSPGRDRAAAGNLYVSLKTIAESMRLEAHSLRVQAQALGRTEAQCIV